MASFDRVIDRLERRLAAAKQIRGFIVEFPDLIQELQDALALSKPNGVPTITVGQLPRLGRPLKTKADFKAETGGVSGTNFERVKAFFAATGNEWISAPDLGRRLGLQRGTVGHMLWTGHPDAFEQMTVEGSKRNKLWRLRSDVLRT